MKTITNYQTSARISTSFSAKIDAAINPCPALLAGLDWTKPHNYGFIADCNQKSGQNYPQLGYQINKNYLYANNSTHYARLINVIYMSSGKKYVGFPQFNGQNQLILSPNQTIYNPIDHWISFLKKVKKTIYQNRSKTIIDPIYLCN